MTKIINSENLTIKDIPTDINWNTASSFALSFDPQIELGTFDIYKTSNMKYNEESTVKELRTVLFLKQRWWNNRLVDIDENGLMEMVNIIKLIKKKLTK